MMDYEYLLLLNRTKNRKARKQKITAFIQNYNAKSKRICVKNIKIRNGESLTYFIKFAYIASPEQTQTRIFKSVYSVCVFLTQSI
jgi:hypothetical protein